MSSPAQAIDVAQPDQRALPALPLYILMITSGFAGLGYEMVWTQMLSVALGHESVAVLAVLGAFFAGLAMGAWLLDALIRNSAVPGRIYALLEATIGVWALLLIVLIPMFNTAVFNILGAEPSATFHWFVAFSGTFILLLPATAAMGATLPAMARVFEQLRNDGISVGGLYAANTAGAMCGTVAGTFVLARLFGFQTTLVLLAMINIGCAATMFLAVGQRRAQPSKLRTAGDDSVSVSTLYTLLTITGLLGLGYEVVAIRVLSQVLENTVFTFASLLAVYLLGTAIGAAAYQRFAAKDAFQRTFRKIVLGLIGASLTGVVMLLLLQPLHTALVRMLGDGIRAGIFGEWVVAMLVFLPPTLFMGASFAHLAQAASTNIGIGRALAVNTMGAAVAPLIFGVVLIPMIGSETCLLLICASYLVLVPRAQGNVLIPAGATLVAIAIIIALPASMRVITVPDAGQLVHFVEGRMANVAVVEDAAGGRFLKVNNQYTMGGTNSRFSDRRQAHLPLLLHPAPKTALFLGLGTGATFIAAEEHPNLSATAVELLPELLDTLSYFGPSAGEVAASADLDVINADARRFVASSNETYDVVIADVFHPARDGAAALYTTEHFAAIGERLNDQGLFCQWLPLFQLDLDTLKSITATFVDVFPNSEMHLAHFSLGQPIVGLIGRKAPYRYSTDYVSRRVTDRDLARDLQSVRLTDDFAVYGGFLASGGALAAFAQDAPINSDNRPIVAYAAPQFLFASPEPAYVRLLALTDALNALPRDFLQPTEYDLRVDSFANRLAAYWSARDDFLRAGVNVTPSNNVREMLERVGESLLMAVQKSPDFSPAYMPLVQMAIEISATEPVVGRQLLLRLEQVAPRRPEARRARQQLFRN
ncbi:MAG: spermidine synthase [Pseudomonadota bacterium]